MPQNGLSCEQNVARTAGIAVYALSDDEERVARAVQSLEAGVPVLTVGQRAGAGMVPDLRVFYGSGAARVFWTQLF